MCVVDNTGARGGARETSLPFEGFLEALVRVSAMKALPTDEEIAASGVADAFDYMAKLRDESPDAHATLIEARATPWGHAPRSQPMHRCVAHLLTIVVRTIEGGTRGGDDGQLTPSEVSDWLKRVGGSSGGAAK